MTAKVGSCGFRKRICRWLETPPTPEGPRASAQRASRRRHSIVAHTSLRSLQHQRVLQEGRMRHVIEERPLQQLAASTVHHLRGLGSRRRQRGKHTAPCVEGEKCPHPRAARGAAGAKPMQRGHGSRIKRQLGRSQTLRLRLVPGTCRGIPIRRTPGQFPTRPFCWSVNRTLLCKNKA